MKRLILSNQEFFDMAEQLLLQGQEVEISVKGQSMRPFLLDGEKVTVAPVSDCDELRVGTIILAKTNNGKIMMHRIHQRKADDILMKGDGNIVQTEAITVMDVLGIVSSINRNGKKLSPYTFPRRIGVWFWRNRWIRRIGLKIFHWLKH